MSNAPRDPHARRDWGNDDSQTPILHVDMDSFFAQVEMCENPSLRSAPLIVGGTGARGVVTSATYEARALGVRAGMPMARARALCPRAHVVSGTRGLYADYSQRVMAVLREITPLVEQVSIDEAFLDVSGARRRLGSPVYIARWARRQIRERIGLPASVGIASTKSVAKIASSHAKPDGLLLVPHTSTVEFLHELPVGVLWGVGAGTEKILLREGIESVQELAQIPLSRLVRLLGAAQAHHLHALANGIDPRQVHPRRREKSVGTERTFEENIQSRSFLELFVLEASHECARRLRESGLVGRTVVLKMRSADFTTTSRSLTLAYATDVGRDVACAAKQLLDRQALPFGGVRLLGVRVEGLSAREEGVAVPLDNDERPLAAERVMDEATRRFGLGALRPATLLSQEKRTESRGESLEH